MDKDCVNKNSTDLFCSEDEVSLKENKALPAETETGDTPEKDTSLINEVPGAESLISKSQKQEGSELLLDRLDSLRDSFDSFSNLFNVALERLDQLKEEFQVKLKYDAHKEKIIDSLHRELQEYKSDLHKKLLQPVILDVIHIIDDLNKLVNNYRAKDKSELEPAKLLDLLESFSSDLEDLLYKQGVEAFNRHDPSFNPSCQRILKTLETEDKSKEKTVAQRIRKGYEWDGKVLRPETVSVYVYKKVGSLGEINPVNKNAEGGPGAE